MNHADEYFKKIAKFTFPNHLANEDVKWASKLAKRCPNLKEIENIQLSNSSFEDVAIDFHCLGGMKNVSHVEIKFFERFSPILILVLADMENLTSVELSMIASDVNSCRPHDDENSFKKLHVKSLKCDHLNFVNFCHPHHLKSLDLNNDLNEMDEILAKLRNFRSLRKISLESTARESKDILNLVNFASEIEEFSLALSYFVNVDGLSELVRNQKVQKCLHRLNFHDIDDEHVEELVSCIRKLSELRAVTFDNVSYEPDMLLGTLSNLEELNKYLSIVVNVPQFNAMCHVNKMYQR